MRAEKFHENQNDINFRIKLEDTVKPFDAQTNAHTYVRTHDVRTFAHPKFNNFFPFKISSVFFLAFSKKTLIKIDIKKSEMNKYDLKKKTHSMQLVELSRMYLFGLRRKKMQYCQFVVIK